MQNILDKFFNILSPVSLFIGRFLLGLYFLLPGIMKFVQWQGHIMLMEKHNMVMIPFLLATAGVVQIVLGACLILNRFVPVAALILAGLVVLININLHDFWNFPAEMQNFVKNTAIFAGLLVLSATSWQEKKRQ